MVAKPRKTLGEMAEEPELGLACRNCGCRDLRVYYTRPKENGIVLRVRICRNCGLKKTTMERETFQE